MLQREQPLPDTRVFGIRIDWDEDHVSVLDSGRCDATLEMEVAQGDEPFFNATLRCYDLTDEVAISIRRALSRILHRAPPCTLQVNYKQLLDIEDSCLRILLSLHTLGFSYLDCSREEKKAANLEFSHAMDEVL